jgi:hypothetical protein
MKLKPEDRLRVILNQIVPAIVDHGDKSFQLRQLETQEGFANHLNEVCEAPIADLPQFFIDAIRLGLGESQQNENCEGST